MDHALWQTAFRPFFLAGLIFAATALSIWGLFWLGQPLFVPYGGWVNWHAHEMLFGFVQAIAIGFLLSAVREWTGNLGIHSKPLIVLFNLWLMGRLLWVINISPPILITAVDTAVPLYAAWWLANTLVSKQAGSNKSQRHNWPFVVLLCLLAGLQFIYHTTLQIIPSWIPNLQKMAVLIMAATTIWVNSRVIPSAYGKQDSKTLSLTKSLINYTATMASWALVPIWLMDSPIATTVIATLAAAAHFFRWLYLLRPYSLKGSIWWSTHIAYLWIIIGYAVIALKPNLVIEMQWLHIITLGGLLGMVIGMIAFMSLGQTGRTIKALPSVSVAFFMVQIATFMRLLAPLGESAIFLSVTALILVFAIGLTLVHYLPILVGPREDGRFG